MHDEPLVGCFDRRTNVDQQAQPLLRVQFETLAIAVDRLTIDVLHHQIGHTLPGDSGVVEASDVRMVERSENLLLALHAFEARCRRDRRNQLDRHGARE